MLIWTAPSEGAGTSHRRQPGGDGDSVFTSRTSSPMKACAGQSRDISWVGRDGVGGRGNPWGGLGLQKRGNGCTWLGESAESREASELTEEDGEAGSTLVWISVGGRKIQELAIGLERCSVVESLLHLQRTVPRTTVSDPKASDTLS